MPTRKVAFQYFKCYDYANAYWLKLVLTAPIFWDRLQRHIKIDGLQHGNSLKILRSQIKFIDDQSGLFVYLFIFYLGDCSVKLQMLSRHLHSDSGRKEGTDHLFLPALQNSWTDLSFPPEISTCRLFEYWCLIDKVIQT